jgi:phage shock protein PspC (stress-responsive transcriptional regulator)
VWTTVAGVHVGTATVFDLGVFVTVLGTVTLVVFTWEETP